MAWLSSKKGIVLVILAVFVATFSIGAVLGEQFKNLFSESIESKDLKGEPFNILFMGIDARDNKSNTRTDTMILASIDPKNKKVAMVSIPRDTHIKDSKGRNEKINFINYDKGPEAACKVVAELLDTEVDYYVLTNFAGFGKIVDALGGVDIDVETNMYHWDVSNIINLKKGNQHLNGDQALQYVRYRGGPTADIGRTQRQQKFIKALANEMFKAKTILKLPALIPEINKYVRTNIPLKDMVYMANMAKKFDSSSITAQTLPGYPYTDPSTGASYWEADQEKATIIVESLLQGKTFSVVGDPPTWMSKQKVIKAPVVIPDAEKELESEVNKDENLDEMPSVDELKTQPEVENDVDLPKQTEQGDNTSETDDQDEPGPLLPEDDNNKNTLPNQDNNQQIPNENNDQVTSN